MNTEVTQLVPVAKIPTFIFDRSISAYLVRLEARPRSPKKLAHKLLLETPAPKDTLGEEFIALDETDKRGNQIYVLRSHVVA